MPAADPSTGNATETPPVLANLRQLRERIDVAARDAGRDGSDVTLVAVSKTKPSALVETALQAGHRVFGENRVQEAAAKFPALRDRYPDLQLHLIGPLQTNKVHQAVALFDVIETLDRPKLARALAKAIAKSGRAPRCFIQVNTGEEPQKAGVLPAELDAFVALARDDLALPVEGLMCIPPVAEPPAPHFALLVKMAARNRLALLSMGMSADYETAVRLGATHVRVGSAIFGARPPHPDPTP